MKKCLSALLLIILLIQALPVEALASVGRVLSDEELDRAYALTGLGKGDGLYHNGMGPNESMSGMQLVGWLEERLDEKLHNVDDVLSRARYRLAELEEKYPTLYEVFTQSPFYEEARALALQVEQLRQDLNYRLERVETDVNMIDAMRSRMQNTEASMFDSDRVRASARIEAATAEIKSIRSEVVRSAALWDATLLEWTAKVQYDSAGGAYAAITASLQAFARSLWKKFNLAEGSDEAFVAELKELLKARYLRFMPGSDQADAFADYAVALMRDMWQQYDPNGETGMAIICQLQSLMERLYQKYGPDGAQDAALIDDVEALMRKLWRDYGPQSPTNRAFVSAWATLIQKYGFDGDSVDEFIAELDALAEELWKKYGPDGEGKDALLAKLMELWSFFGGMDQGGSIARWLSSLFTAQSEPVTNSAPVTAVSNALSRTSRLSAAAGVQSNDADASVTVISKDQICLSFVTGVNQQRTGVPGVEVRFKDASIAGTQLSEPQYSNEKGLVILPTNLFAADKYDEVHVYVEVDPRKQGYRNHIIEDLEVSLGQTFMDTLVPMEDEGVVSNAPSEPYMISASFNGKDIMHSEYEMIYSPANNALFMLHVFRVGWIALALMAVCCFALAEGADHLAPEVSADDRGKVVILATGGTIAGVGEEGKTEGYQSGSLSVEELLSSVPELDQVARLEAVQVSNVNSDDITAEVWLDLAKTVNEMAGDPTVKGFVVTHGTDTLEETAYFLNLTVKTEKPVVITGSIRPSTSISADGPMNLYESVCVAASQEAVGQGVLAVFSDCIFTARSVTKRSTYQVTAINAGEVGDVGVVRDGEVYLYETTGKKHTTMTEFDVRDLTELPRVSIVYFAVDADPALLKYAADHSDGLVIAGAGAGEFSKAFMEVIEGLQIPVVISSRTEDGIITKDNLLCEGTVAADNLSPQKAAILLRLALTKGADAHQLERMFLEY